MARRRFEEVKAYSLLANLAGTKETAEFVQSTLGKLIEYDRSHNTEFLPTLTAYLLSGKNKKQTVEALFIHPNTLKYRLRKIEEILSLKLSDPEACFKLELAVRLLPFGSSSSL